MKRLVSLKIVLRRYQYSEFTKYLIEALWSRLKSSHLNRNQFQSLKIENVTLDLISYDLAKVCMYARPFCKFKIRSLGSAIFDSQGDKGINDYILGNYYKQLNFTITDDLKWEAPEKKSKFI